MGNCSRWVTHAFIFCTNIWNLATASASGRSSDSGDLGQPRNTCRKVRILTSLLISSWPSRAS